MASTPTQRPSGDWQTRWWHATELTAAGKRKAYAIQLPTHAACVQAKAVVEAAGHAITRDECAARMIERTNGNGARPAVERTPAAPTFRQVADELLAVLESDADSTGNTRYKLANGIAQFAAWYARPITEISTNDAAVMVRSFRTRAKSNGKPYSELTADSWIKYASRVFNHAIAQGIVRTNPLSGLNVLGTTRRRKPRRTKTVRALDYGDYGILLDVAERHSPELFALIHLMSGAGLRIGEALAMEVRYVRGRRTSADVEVAQQWTRDATPGAQWKLTPPKWESYGTMPVSAEVYDAVRPFVVNKAPGDLLFPGLKYDDFTKRWSELVALCHAAGFGMADPTAHDLRHTYGAYLIDQGRDLLQVSRLMRHQGIQVTADIYGDRLSRGDDQVRAATTNATAYARSMAAENRAA